MWQPQTHLSAQDGRSHALLPLNTAQTFLDPGYSLSTYHIAPRILSPRLIGRRLPNRNRCYDHWNRRGKNPRYVVL
jgi:hypothetical protein